MAVGGIDFRKAAAGANGLDVALGENGAEPGLERAAAVEIAEEGATVGSIGEAIEVGEKRVSEFAGCRRVRRAAEDGSGGGAEISAEGGNEMIPGCRGALCASAGEGEVLKVEIGKILVELRCFGLFSKVFSGAVFKGGGEDIARQTP